MGQIVISIVFSVYLFSLTCVYVLSNTICPSCSSDWVYNGEIKQLDLCKHGVYSVIEEIKLTLNSS